MRHAQAGREAEGQETNKKKSKKRRERDPWTKIIFIPSGREDKKKHTREHLNCDLYMIND